MNDAELYHACNQLQRQDTLFFLNKYLSKIKWKEGINSILDIGSGDGSVTHILKSHIPPECEYKILGIDISEDMIKYANKHKQDKNIAFTKLDIAGNMPQKLLGKFDHVFSFYALHWVMDQKLAYSNIYNLLNDGGECFMIFIGGSPIYNVFHMLQKIDKWRPYISNLDKYISPYNSIKEPDQTLKELMDNIGFVDIEVEYKDLYYLYANKDIARKSLKSICPFQIPDNLCEEFMDDYVLILRELGFVQMPDEGNEETVKKEYRLLIAFGRKPS